MRSVQLTMISALGLLALACGDDGSTTGTPDADGGRGDAGDSAVVDSSGDASLDTGATTDAALDGTSADASSDGMTPDASSDGMTPDASDTSAACTSASDCDDGLFCNGTEDCVGGTCTAGTAPVVDDGVDCTVDSCDEDTDAVVNTADDSACASLDRIYCDATGAVAQDVGSCNSTSGCEPITTTVDPCDPTPACSTAGPLSYDTRSCVEAGGTASCVVSGTTCSMAAPACVGDVYTVQTATCDDATGCSTMTTTTDCAAGGGTSCRDSSTQVTTVCSCSTSTGCACSTTARNCRTPRCINSRASQTCFSCLGTSCSGCTSTICGTRCDFSTGQCEAS